MVENISSARRNSYTAFLCVVFMILTRVLFLLRIGSVNIPIDYIMSVANTTINSSSIVYIQKAFTFFRVISILEMSKLDEIFSHSRRFAENLVGIGKQSNR